MQQLVLEWLYRELKKTRIDYAHAEERRHNGEELRNLKQKIAILEWLTEVVGAMEDKT